MILSHYEIEFSLLILRLRGISGDPTHKVGQADAMWVLKKKAFSTDPASFRDPTDTFLETKT